METYAYRVRDREGRLLEGSLEADSSGLVANKLRQMGYTPIAIDRRDGSSLQRELRLPGRGSKVKLKELAVFSRQFATVINAGLSLLRALNILVQQTESAVLREVVNQVRMDIERGSSLSAALARHPKVFNRLYVAMVRAGESGGVLDGVLLQLAATIEKQVELRRKIVSAVTYPAAVFGLVLLIVTAMLLFVVPMFAGMYDDLGGTLPLPTRILMGVSGLVKTTAPLWLLGTVAAVFGVRRWKQTEAGRARWDAIKLRLPVFGSLLHKTAMSRFARTFSVLMRSGVPILDALEITATTVDNAVVSTAVRDVQAAVKRGEPVAKPMAEHAIFPAMVTQMVAVGEETGAVDTMLEKLGEFYDQEIEAAVSALTSLLEPLLIVVMGGTVGGMVLALYLPMFNILDLVQQ